MSKNTRNEMCMFVNVIGLTGWDAGLTENALVVEGLTSLLIGTKMKYGSLHVVIHITGVHR